MTNVNDLHQFRIRTPSFLITADYPAQVKQIKTMGLKIVEFWNNLTFTTFLDDPSATADNASGATEARGRYQADKHVSSSRGSQGNFLKINGSGI